MVVMMRVIHRIIPIQAHELLKAATIEKSRLPPYLELETSFYLPKKSRPFGSAQTSPHPASVSQAIIGDHRRTGRTDSGSPACCLHVRFPHHFRKAGLGLGNTLLQGDAKLTAYSIAGQRKAEKAAQPLAEALLKKFYLDKQ
jgi:hypothetical protein